MSKERLGEPAQGLIGTGLLVKHYLIIVWMWIKVIECMWISQKLKIPVVLATHRGRGAGLVITSNRPHHTCNKWI